MRASLWFLFLTAALSAQDGILEFKEWRGHPGDDPAWANPSFEDSAWNTTGLPGVVSDSRPGWCSYRASSAVRPGFNGPLGFAVKASWMADSPDASATWRALGTLHHLSPGQVLSGLNEALAGHAQGRFVTCCCALFSPDGRVTLANAGHPAPYAGGLEIDTEPDLPLGIAAGVEYGETSCDAFSGRFTLVSGGVVEAKNARRELFGFERTREISGKSAGEIADAAKAWARTTTSWWLPCGGQDERTTGRLRSTLPSRVRRQLRDSPRRLGSQEGFVDLDQYGGHLSLTISTNDVKMVGTRARHRQSAAGPEPITLRRAMA